jgi:HD superfamily phosphohydrolase
MENTVKQINDWKTLKSLGIGSYGETFLAENSKGERAAVKLLLNSAEPNGAARFENEAWALRKLDHPNIPKLLDEGNYDGRPFIVMSLARGKTLGSLRERQIKQNSYIGQILLLDIIIEVFAALVEMHSKDICHRDIKDNNIMLSDAHTRVVVIDLGFCKGSGQPREADTFFNAGASRFSHPGKASHPKKGVPEHDVFSVGVLAYLLLTNEFPWSVTQGQDAGDLRDLMKKKAPTSIYAINNTVSPTVSDFILNHLLSIDESHLPSASKALAEASSIRNSLSGLPIAQTRRGSDQIPLTRIVRDPIHGDIRLTENEWDMMNSPEFQRLRYIKQLGFTNLIYPSAEHTRFAHSLGTLFVTEKILRSIEETHGENFPIEDRQMARTYALLHDVNHIPYGHTIEDELGIFDRHDLNDSRTQRLFFGESKLGGVLRRTDYGRNVLDYFDPSATIRKKIHLREFIDAPHGSDVIDYIDRDSYFCGLDHKVDSAIYRRYKMLRDGIPSDVEQHLGLRLYGDRGIRLDADYALERILTERFSLFLKVYCHSMKFSAGAMLGKALFPSTQSKRRNNPFSQEQLERYSDMELLLRLSEDQSEISAALAKMLLNRCLFKPVYKGAVLDSLELAQVDSKSQEYSSERKITTPGGRDEFERALSKKCNVNSNDVIVYCPKKPPGLQKINTWIEDEPGQIGIKERRAGHGFDLLKKRHIQMWHVFVFVAPTISKEKRETIGQEAQIAIGPKNEIALNAKDFVLGL